MGGKVKARGTRIAVVSDILYDGSQVRQPPSRFLLDNERAMVEHMEEQLTLDDTQAARGVFPALKKRQLIPQQEPTPITVDLRPVPEKLDEILRRLEAVERRQELLRDATVKLSAGLIYDMRRLLSGW